VEGRRFSAAWGVQNKGGALGENLARARQDDDIGVRFDPRLLFCFCIAHLVVITISVPSTCTTGLELTRMRMYDAMAKDAIRNLKL
jgi:hypothetical protein